LRTAQFSASGGVAGVGGKTPDRTKAYHIVLFCSLEGHPMKKIFALSLIAAASLGLAACSEKSAAESTELNAVDANVAAEEAVADINATAEGAVADANAMLDNAAMGDAGVANGTEAEMANNAM
jgi:hypothetical protein